MKKKLLFLFATLLASPVAQTFACATCMAGQGSKTNANMAIAIWVMIGAVMSVLGGVGAFGFHLWRHATIPLEPHEQLITEDLESYE